MPTPRRLPLFPLLFALASGPALRGADPVEKWMVFDDGATAGHRVRVTQMASEVRPGGATDTGTCLWLNDDWKARPWAAITLGGGEPLTITREWYDKGFLRFLVNSTVTQYNQPVGNLRFQLFLGEVGYQTREIVRPQHIQRGRGLDEDATSWQEVMFPLNQFRDLQVGDVIQALTIQTRWQNEIAFGLDEVGLVRYEELPAWFVEMRQQKVLQPDVEWPAADLLPESLRADRHPPRVVDGQFVDADGRRVFILNPYVREVAEHDLWGNPDGRKRPPTHGLYDEERHGWIYNELLTAESLVRLGFNSLSVTMPPQPWYEHLGYSPRDPRELRAVDPVAEVHPLPDLVERVQVPFHIDMVFWPWTVGRPALEGFFPEELLTRGRHHWMDLRILGPARQLWMDLWRLNAERYAQAGAKVLTYELLNEPAYLSYSEDHLAEFAVWLKERYGGVEAVNAAWGTRFHSVEEASNAAESDDHPRILGRYLDYDEYMAHRFRDFIREGVELVAGILPGTLVGLQPLGAYVQGPREGVWPFLLAEVTPLIMTTTDGGSWTTGHGAAARPASTILTPIAEAPLEDELLLSIAGNKMIYDNEVNLEGQTRPETFSNLWRRVLVGADGLSIFSWSKRGWDWYGDRATIEALAERYPYSILNPAARRTESIRGLLDFTASLQPIAGDILPKPWGPEPKIAYLYSWHDARRRVLEPSRVDKRGAYFAALRYSHWNMAVVPSDQALADGALDRFAVVVMPATVNVEPELPSILHRFVERGGILLVGEDLFAHDIHGRPLENSGFTGIHDTRPGREPAGRLVGAKAQAPDLLPGPVTSTRPSRQPQLAPDVTVLMQDATGAPVLTSRRLGKGLVYYQGADVIGYPLAHILWSGLLDAAAQKGLPSVPDTWRSAELTDTRTGELATNVLVSRRSYDAAGRHGLILLNRDGFPKTVRIRIPLPDGTYRVEHAVGDGEYPAMLPETATSAEVRGRGLVVTLRPSDPSVIILRRISRGE